MKVKLPQIPKVLDVLKDLKRQILHDETISSAAISDEDISKFECVSFSANELRLEKVDFTEAKLERTNFSDLEFINCKFVASSLPEASWRRVAIKNSLCSGLQLQSSMLKDITFNNCRLNLANFRFSKLKNIDFIDCLLDEADFYSAEIENVSFQNCTLNKVQFSDAKLKNVDLRSSTIQNVLGIRGLAGATVDSVQLASLAPLLANELKLKVSDE